jgi:HK97 family phage prohead protease
VSRRTVTAEAVIRGVQDGSLSIAHPHVREVLRRHVGGVQRRSLSFRAEAAGEGIVRAIPCVWDVTYRISATRSERVRRGAFAASIRQHPNVPIFQEHRWDQPIGHSTSLEETSRGLEMTALLYLDSERGRSAWKALKAGALKEWSVGFLPQTLSQDPNDPRIDVVERARLLECSCVVLGANPETSTVDVRHYGRNAA